MRSSTLRTAGSAAIGAIAVLALGAIMLPPYGPQAGHMAAHIASMNVVAPLLAALVATRRRLPDARPALLWVATLGQIVLIWAFHTPTIQALAMSDPRLEVGMHAVLLLAALLFWLALLTLSASRRWQAVPALLLTGKLTCLLAALLVFAPRALYAVAGHGMHVLDDQHLAGLLMIAACPLGYVLPALMITLQLIRDATAWRGSLRTTA
jgi:putative membrane protein